MARYLKESARPGRSDTYCNKPYNLPRRADFKVA